MSNLPPALSAWGPELEGMQEDLACALEPWLLRLSTALGPLATRRSAQDGPPDGFDGLTRRGRYERLLPSEWILAELHPEEFLRRATNAEHLFYALARQAPAADQRTVLLFDAGPDQLGAPRLLHLAFLLTMARRARYAQVDLSWGVLQAETPQLLDSVTAQSVLTLMRTRSPDLAAPEQLQAYLALLPGPPINDEDVWLVGGRHIEVLARSKMRRARIREPLALSQRLVTLELSGRTSRPLQFELPPEPEAIRLIRNPFAIGARAVDPGHHPGGRPSEVFFSEDGRTLFVRSEDGFWTYPLPRQNGHRAAAQRLDEAQGRVIAAGRVGRGHYLIIDEDGRPAIEYYSRHGGESERLYLDSGHGWDSSWPDSQISRCVMQGGKRSKAVLILDNFGRVLRIQVVGLRTMVAFCYGVSGLGRALGGTVMVLNADGSEHRAPSGDLPLCNVAGTPIQQVSLPKRAIIVLDGQGRTKRIVHLEQGGGNYRAVFSTRWVAVKTKADQWFLLGRDTQAEIKNPDGYTVLGLHSQEDPALIARGPDPRRLYLLTPDGVEASRCTSIVHSPLAVSPKESLVAYLKPDGGLRVEDYNTGASALDFHGTHS